jgi:ubiquinone/menaquinone biosynthesis C-methylase UbiE
MEEFRRQARNIAVRLASGSNLLELAPGPGFFALELIKLGDFKITGLDISRTFVEIAKENARNADAALKIDFRWGNASAMPFADESFDFVYCAAAFKNFSEPIQALDEAHRVLRPAGKAVIVDLSKDASPAEIDSYIRQSGRRAFDAWLTRWAFRSVLLKRAYTRDDFVQMARQSRFGCCEVLAVPLGFEVRFRKLARESDRGRNQANPT